MNQVNFTQWIHLSWCLQPTTKNVQFLLFCSNQFFAVQTLMFMTGLVALRVLTNWPSSRPTDLMTSLRADFRELCRCKNNETEFAKEPEKSFPASW